MAIPNEDELLMSVKLNKKLAKQAQDTIDDLYKNTYFSDNKDKQYIDTIKNRMSQSINGLIDKTKIRTGDTNISDLYARTLAKSDTNMTVMKDITDSAMLSDILDIYSNNMVVRDMDREIDVVMKYMPRLKRAIDLIQTSVLAADHANEDDIAIHVINSIKDTEGSSDSNPVSASSNDKITACIKKYDFKRLKKTLYNKTATYGEQFVYIVPYNKAIERLMRKSKPANIMSESAILEDSQIESLVEDATMSFDVAYLDESSEADNDFIGVAFDPNNLTINEKAVLDEYKEDVENIKIELNASGVIPSLVSQANTMRRVLSETSNIFGEATVKTDYGMVKSSEILKNADKEFKKFIKDSVKTPGEKHDLVSPDGLTTTDNTKVDVPGCIVELLDHEYVKPLYIDRKTCLGYYYIECDSPMDMGSQTTFTSTLGGLRPRRATRDRANMDKTQMDNQVLTKIAKQISEKIDKKFINANQDLANEIYSVLKYNADHSEGKVSRIRISFLPPEDIVHSYFNMNEKTHRGKSDLEQSLFPAKLYSCLYISNSIALLTRGYDKRIYRVRQTVDTNITAVLLNVINQIKQSNFNLRQIENMNNILNITGRFNDLVIPQSANGESPVTTEILPGQNIDVKTEFMNGLEEMAIEQTGVSIEMISNHYQAEQTATNVVQNNERYLIMIRERQELYQEILSAVLTKIYQAEEGTNDIVSVELPAPRGLNFSNTSQMLASGNDLIQNIVQMKLGQSQDEGLKARFTGKLMEYYYTTMLPMDDIDRLYDEAQLEAKQEPAEDNQAGGGMGGY